MKLNYIILGFLVLLKTYFSFNTQEQKSDRTERVFTIAYITNKHKHVQHVPHKSETNNILDFDDSNYITY